MQVFKGRMSGTTIVACKVMDHQSAQELARFAKEVEILKDLRHINIVQVCICRAVKIWTLLSVLILHSGFSCSVHSAMF